MKAYSLFDGSIDLAGLAEKTGMPLETAAGFARGMELSGLLERRGAAAGASILVLDDDPDAVRVLQSVLGPDGRGAQLKFVRDKIGAQLLIRRQQFDLVIVALDRPDRESFVRACKEHCTESTRFVGIVGLEDEDELVRLDAMELDGVLHRPLAESDLKATIEHLLCSHVREAVGAA